MNTNVTNYFVNATDLSSLLQVANSTTGGFTYFGLLVMEQIIIFVALLGTFGTSVTAAGLTSAFICLISGMFLVYLGLMTWSLLMMFLGQILFLIMYITWNSKSGGDS